MTPEELAIEVNDRKTLTRSDVQSVLDYYKDQRENAEVYLQQFLESLTFLTSDDRIKVLIDFPSYVF